MDIISSFIMDNDEFMKISQLDLDFHSYILG